MKERAAPFKGCRRFAGVGRRAEGAAREGAVTIGARGAVQRLAQHAWLLALGAGTHNVLERRVRQSPQGS